MPKLSLQAKKTRLESLIASIDAGNDVATRDMRAVMTPEKFNQFQQDWEHQLDLRRGLRDKPAEVQEYEEKVKRAIFAYNKGEGYSGSSRRRSVRGKTGLSTATRAHNKGEALAEKAIEYYGEILEMNPGLQYWFVFPELVHIGSGLSPENLPRAITSRSFHVSPNLQYFGIMAKRDVKRQALRASLDDVVAELSPSQPSAESDEESLKKAAEFLKWVKSQR